MNRLHEIKLNNTFNNWFDPSPPFLRYRIYWAHNFPTRFITYLSIANKPHWTYTSIRQTIQIRPTTNCSQSGNHRDGSRRDYRAEQSASESQIPSHCVAKQYIGNKMINFDFPRDPILSPTCDGQNHLHSCMLTVCTKYTSSVSRTDMLGQPLYNIRVRV